MGLSVLTDWKSGTNLNSEGIQPWWIQSIYFGKFCHSFDIHWYNIRSYVFSHFIVCWSCITLVSVMRLVNFQTQDFPVMKQQTPKFQKRQLTGRTTFHKWRWSLRLLMYDLSHWHFMLILSSWSLANDSSSYYLMHRMEAQQHERLCSQRATNGACRSSPTGTELVASGATRGPTRVAFITTPTFVAHLRCLESYCFTRLGATYANCNLTLFL